MSACSGSPTRCPAGSGSAAAAAAAVSVVVVVVVAVAAAAECIPGCFAAVCWWRAGRLAWSRCAADPESASGGRRRRMSQDPAYQI